MNTLIELVAEFYRAKETANLSLRIGEISTDVVYILIRLCEKNNISVEEGVWRVLDEVKILTDKIQKVNSLPPSELLMYRGLKSSDESLQGDKSDGDLTEPFIRFCFVFRAFGEVVRLLQFRTWVLRI